MQGLFIWWRYFFSVIFFYSGTQEKNNISSRDYNRCLWKKGNSDSKNQQMSYPSSNNAFHSFCAICQERIDVSTSVWVLAGLCGHAFHRVCHRSCPTCREYSSQATLRRCRLSDLQYGPIDQVGQVATPPPAAVVVAPIRPPQNHPVFFSHDWHPCKLANVFTANKKKKRSWLIWSIHLLKLVLLCYK